MLILGLETSGEAASIALVEGDKVRCEELFPARQRLSQCLVPAIQAMLEREQVPLRSLGGIAVGLGPGSFTGLRIGVVTAKALAHAAHLPLVGLTVPEALARDLSFLPGYTICVIQEALRDEVYATLYQTSEAGELQETMACAVVLLEELLPRLMPVRERVVFCGDATPKYSERIAEVLGPRALPVPPPFNCPRASHLALQARERLAAADPAAAFNLRPLYVRRSQAEVIHKVDLGLS